MESLEEKRDSACTFCGKGISFGESVCSDCRSKFHISSSDQGMDGCGCDK